MTDTADMGQGGQRVPCPECAELILPAAKVCRFCGFKIASRDISAIAVEAAPAAIRQPAVRRPRGHRLNPVIQPPRLKKTVGIRPQLIISGFFVLFSLVVIIICTFFSKSVGYYSYFYPILQVGLTISLCLSVITIPVTFFWFLYELARHFDKQTPIEVAPGNDNTSPSDINAQVQLLPPPRDPQAMTFKGTILAIAVMLALTGVGVMLAMWDDARRRAASDAQLAAYRARQASEARKRAALKRPDIDPVSNRKSISPIGYTFDINGQSCKVMSEDSDGYQVIVYDGFNTFPMRMSREIVLRAWAPRQAQMYDLIDGLNAEMDADRARAQGGGGR